MRNYTHIAGAILLYITFAYLTNQNNLLMGVFFAGWISVFPDIIDKILGKHRGYGHSIFWLIPFTLIGIWDTGIAAALIIGFLSHIFLDILTVHGCPLLYPLRDASFVCFNKGRRIKTGTNQEKAVLLFILSLLIPIFLLYTGLGTLLLSKDGHLVFAAGDSNSQKNDTLKNTFNLNFALTENVKKNITIKKISENETVILIDDIRVGG